jgi:hypothetical protein
VFPSLFNYHYLKTNQNFFILTLDKRSEIRIINGYFCFEEKRKNPLGLELDFFFSIPENFSDLKLVVSVPFLLTASFFLWYVYFRMSEVGTREKKEISVSNQRGKLP